MNTVSCCVHDVYRICIRSVHKFDRKFCPRGHVVDPRCWRRQSKSHPSSWVDVAKIFGPFNGGSNIHNLPSRQHLISNIDLVTTSKVRSMNSLLIALFLWWNAWLPVGCCVDWLLIDYVTLQNRWLEFILNRKHLKKHYVARKILRRRGSCWES